jgi:chromosome segregation ATPase
MSDLTEKSLGKVLREARIQFEVSPHADMHLPERSERWYADRDEWMAQAVASHATAELQSSLQKCQGEVEELQQSLGIANHEIESHKNISHDRTFERDQLRALLAEAREALTSVVSISTSTTERQSERLARNIVDASTALTKIYALIGEQK